MSLKIYTLSGHKMCINNNNIYRSSTTLIFVHQRKFREINLKKIKNTLTFTCFKRNPSIKLVIKKIQFILPQDLSSNYFHKKKKL